MRIVRLWIPVIVWMIVIFAFSTRQRVSVSEEYALNFLFFKTLHVIEYGFLYLLFVRAIRGTWSKLANWELVAAVCALLYAASDEIHQTFVPTREGSPRDVIIDALGVTIAWIIITYGIPHLPQKLRKLVSGWLRI